MKNYNLINFDLKTTTVVLISICAFLIGCIYYRTPYFENSISTQEITFERTSDTISSSKWYVDMVGNWILLDQNIVIQNNNTGVIVISNIK